MTPPRKSKAVSARGHSEFRQSQADTSTSAGALQTTVPRGRVKSLAKGLAALDILLTTPTLGTTELARRLDINRSAASRILRTLLDAGFVDRLDARRYTAGAKLEKRIRSFSPPFGIKNRVRPLLHKLADLTGESAHLGVLVDDQVLYFDRVDSPMALKVDRPVGTMAPLHCTALGRVFLAFAGFPIPRELRRYTANTPIDIPSLEARLRTFRSLGYAIDDEEFAEGIRCIAAPLREPDESVSAAIGLSGPTARVTTERVPDLGELLLKVADDYAVIATRSL